MPSVAPYDPTTDIEEDDRLDDLETYGEPR